MHNLCILLTIFSKKIFLRYNQYLSLSVMNRISVLCRTFIIHHSLLMLDVFLFICHKGKVCQYSRNEYQTLDVSIFSQQLGYSCLIMRTFPRDMFWLSYLKDRSTFALPALQRLQNGMKISHRPAQQFWGIAKLCKNWK